MIQCDRCAHCVSEYVRVDERGGYYEDDCELAYSDDVWTDEDLEAMERGECPHYKPKEVAE